MQITIIGAGIIGVAAAHALLDEGHAVTLVDPGNRAGRASDGNAGWIAHTDVMPLASPKVWRNLPGWLLDPMGPLAIRPSYLPRLAPWLIRFVAASSPGRMEASIAATRSINAQALPAWRRRLASLGLESRLRESGVLSVWRDRASFERAAAILERQRSFGIGVEVLDPVDLKRLEPALENVAAAVHYPEGCHVDDPAGLVATLLRLALDRGAKLIEQDASDIVVGEDALDIHLRGMEGGHRADRVIVAAGAWSGTLAKQLGDRVPLDTERGYNATFPPGMFALSRPVMYEGQGFVTTPLAGGDRVGGAVEFAGVAHPPDHRRTNAILARLRRFLPHVDVDAPAQRWMGFRPSIPDSLPVIGPARRDGRVIYAFGHGHHGLTQAAATAEAVAALATGRKCEWNLAAFTPRRFV